MWQNDNLLEHIETSSSITSLPFVTSEWNMNIPDNILQIGNYRYRPYERLTTPVLEQSPYASLQNAFDAFDLGEFYTGATDADVIIDGGYEDSTQSLPSIFKSKKDKELLLFSLEDCFGRLRPRSGINKLRYLETENQYLSFVSEYFTRRPRYYMAHKDDKFKYWTSYRTESGEERGIANHLFAGQYFIDDTAPFVVYKNKVPTNRIIVKMQTDVGDIDLGPFQNNSGLFADPFYGEDNMSVPERWKIEYLENDNWITAASFDENFIRENGNPLIGSDGYVELFYGLKVPVKFKNFFRHAGDYQSSSSLPSESFYGDAYLVGATETSPGQYYIWNGDTYDPPIVPEYGWQVKDEGAQTNNGFAANLVDPPKFVNPITGKVQYREFQYVSGLRIVVETMRKNDAVFNLIELSPRLSVDLTGKVVSYDVSKPASDLGVSGMPVGQLLAGTGSMTIFDYDGAFLETNTSSIVSSYISQNIQIKLTEVIRDGEGLDYYIPIKTMYTEGFAEYNTDTRIVSFFLRDLYFYLENSEAPQLFLTNVSLSHAVSILLDSIGFSNYTFKRISDEAEPIIPNFFVPPNRSVAEVLQDLAISSQSTMFFDEYNNFVVMSREYIMPKEEDRPTDITLYGSTDFEQSNILRNSATQTKLANIISIASQENKIFNAGVIRYASRYIGREASLSTSTNKLDRDKRFNYSLAQLWNISSEKTAKIRTNGVTQETGYTLAAMPLASDLSNSFPAVSNGRLVNNVIDFGESVYWLSRYSGYFYANGEVIKYDAIEYSIPGLVEGVDSDNGSTVWITSEMEYEKYFSRIPFNGKMYPTGKVRIFAEPNYEVINGITKLKTGAVAKHGRCQFGTGELGTDGKTYPIYHSAGLNSYWSNNNNVRGVRMESKYLTTGQNYKSSSFLISSLEIVSNEATVGTNQDHDFVTGDTVYIEGVSDVYNGAHSITGVTNDTFTFDTDTESATQEFPSSIESIAYVVKYDDYNSTQAAGQADAVARRTKRSGIIKNFLSSSPDSESETNTVYSTDSGMVQSSALVFSGGTFAGQETPLDYVSYVYKPLNNSFKHFGTRMRIVGKAENDENRLQTPVGVMSFYGVSEPTPEQLASIGGASGGIATMIDPNKNTGYYFEIVSLTANNISSYINGSELHDVIFYKVVGANGSAVPIKLWGGYAGILSNSGEEVGQARVAGEENPTVYDLAIEYEDVGTTRKFYLYLNNSLISIVDDVNPLPVVNNVALFIRGTSRCMFENLYALTNNYAQNTASSLNLPAQSVFAKNIINTDDALRKYAMSGILQESYLSGLSSSEPPAYSLYYEEFGTIMREAAYLDIKYTKAYPALIAKLVPSFSRLKGYVTSGFLASPYGAEFLLFNATDSILNVGEAPNSLSIIGVTFTEESQVDYTVDDYFNSKSDLSKQNLFGTSPIVSPEKTKEDYFNIKLSRIEHGRNEFALNVPYLQTQEEAESLMSWMVSKIMKPRLAVGVSIFMNPMIQLGDIVQLSYNSLDGYPTVAPESSRFVVYNIEHSRSSSGPTMSLYLSEVK